MTSPYLFCVASIVAFISFSTVNAASLSGVAYNFSAPQTGPTDSADLDSITVAGVTFTDLIVPTQYTNESIAANAQIRLNTVDQGIGPTDAGWNAAALAAYQSSNLNDYQQLDAVGLNAKWRLDFGNAFSNATNAFVVVTERNLNNTFSIESFNASGASLGVLSIGVSDYTASGAVSFGTDGSTVEDIGAATFAIADLIGGNATSDLSYVEITNNFSADDGGDGKVLFVTNNVQSVPEPSSGILLLMGLSSLLVNRRR